MLFLWYPFLRGCRTCPLRDLTAAPEKRFVPATLKIMQSTAATNPLLGGGFRIPFDRIRADDVEPAIASLLTDARLQLEALATVPAERSFANTMSTLDELTEPLDYAMVLVKHLESVATYPELRAALNAVQPKTSAFY